MADQKNNQDPLDVEEALMTSEAFLFKYKNIIVGVVVAIVVIAMVITTVAPMMM